ncbi:hypothetical protein BO94DRAFT_613392 [Aspergillus sclerotioniger CBS 115572]|uniref:Uncharacterized protein n=1 Tax=Aspergillus sclerotioniger CBS 115572 TaxID=1450535 RepID=A0A317XBK1_9EURO|nr:hypothetical protein BO94DRAFT_613392 [Aspergillus sclerotioniger CBS 115572]PWY94338.1 hypothetical protein BO94DRAFT_613392 [Aspergillus sclerotioniger CBS 115572]
MTSTPDTPTTAPPTTTTPQTLTIPLTIPNRAPLTLTITITRNTSPRDVGFHLLFPSTPITSFLDFPICQATLTPSQPSTSTPPPTGYASLYGWIQFVRSQPPSEPPSPSLSSKDTEKKKEIETWTHDPLPLTSSTNTPFAYFGHLPTMFDAPAYPDATEMDWTARTFLVYVDDCLMSRVVRPVVAFEWGFLVTDGKKEVKGVREVGVERWEEHLGGWGGGLRGGVFLEGILRVLGLGLGGGMYVMVLMVVGA